VGIGVGRVNRTRGLDVTYRRLRSQDRLHGRQRRLRSVQFVQALNAGRLKVEVIRLGQSLVRTKVRLLTGLELEHELIGQDGAAAIARVGGSERARHCWRGDTWNGGSRDNSRR